MITSTPKKAISSEAHLIHCLICAESLSKVQLSGTDTRYIIVQQTNTRLQDLSLAKVFYFGYYRRKSQQRNNESAYPWLIQCATSTTIPIKFSLYVSDDNIFR